MGLMLEPQSGQEVPVVVVPLPVVFPKAGVALPLESKRYVHPLCSFEPIVVQFSAIFALDLFAPDFFVLDCHQVVLCLSRVSQEL